MSFIGTGFNFGSFAGRIPVAGSGTFPVVAGADDGHCYADSSGYSNSWTDLSLGRYANQDYYNFFRFQSVTIPKGATIDSALIRFFVANSTGALGVRQLIVGEDVDNSSAPANGAAITGATLTTATVTWENIGAWVKGDVEDTPDIKTIVQEIVNRGSWASGNSMTIQIRENGSDGNEYKNPEAIEGDASNPPKLVVEWTA